MRRTSLAVLPALVFLLAGSALADGFIVIPRHPPRRPEIRTIPLAVKYHRVKVTIRDQVARTEIDQVFVNPNPYALEGTYIFPLPEEASISGFSMFIDGKEVPGELLEKEKARKIYRDIVRSLRDPALLEYAGRRMFRASIFPIPARGEKRVKLAYEEVCPADGGLVRYRYPLNTEKFSSRPLQDVSVVVDIRGEKPIKNITCPTHPVEVVMKGDTEARVGYEAKNVTPDRDFILYYSLSAEEFALNFLTHRPKPEEDGYFMLLLSPGAGKAKVMEKDVCFVFDKSGSMQGAKIKQARAALRFCVQSLNPGDRFNLIPFATTAEPFSDTLVPATEANVAKAVEYVADIRAAGGTAIDEALTRALSLAPSGDRPYMIVFLTDGLPTIGETAEPAILAHVKAKNRGNVRLFVFGVGNDVNTHLLDKLAGQNHGARTYVAESEDIEIKVSSFFAKVSHPVLSDLALSFPGLRVTDVYPRMLPDLFRGSQLVVVGRYSGSGARALKLTGRVAGETRTIAHDVVFPEKTDRNPFLPRLWAIRKIGFLLDEIRLHGEKKELRDEVVRLARLHGVVTPYTSFLVLEDTRRNRALSRTEPRRRARDKRLGELLGLAGGRGGDGSGAPPSADAPAAPGGAFGLPEEDEESLAEGLRRATGKKAVDASKEAAKLKGEMGDAGFHAFIPDLGREAKKGVMRLVSGVAFYRYGNVWVQAGLPEKAERKVVELFSDDYFALLDEQEKAGPFLALGKVIFSLDGVIYIVK